MRTALHVHLYINNCLDVYILLEHHDIQAMTFLKMSRLKRTVVFTVVVMVVLQMLFVYKLHSGK